jgi:hypothetical protein
LCDALTAWGNGQAILRMLEHANLFIVPLDEERQSKTYRLALTEQNSRQALEYLPERDLTWRSAATVALGDAYSSIGELATAYRGRLEALEASKAAGNIHFAPRGLSLAPKTSLHP